MKKSLASDLERYITEIQQSGLSIYDPIEVGNPKLWIPSKELEEILNCKLEGVSLAGLPIRSRSKLVKQEICKALCYPIPKSFKKTQPRFIGQKFDTYTQKSNNLQIWNEELEASRRYVLIRVNTDDVVVRVKVVTGEELAVLDTTGTLTQKYQARLIPSNEQSELIVTRDTDQLFELAKLENISRMPKKIAPTDYPSDGLLLSITALFEILKGLVGSSFPDVGYDQERNRGASLHRIVSKALGYENYLDDGRFPDICHQLLEIKLQTSPTIDLGLVCPNSEEPLDIPQLGGRQIRHCDVRYGLFYATTNGEEVTLKHFYLTTGAAFFTRFPQFQGKVLNKKLQIPLPSNFFSS